MRVDVQALLKEDGTLVHRERERNQENKSIDTNPKGQRKQLPRIDSKQFVPFEYMFFLLLKTNQLDALFSSSFFQSIERTQRTD